MPTFYPSHDDDSQFRSGDSQELCSFIRGYLGAAEWLARHGESNDENDNSLPSEKRDRLTGWHRSALKEARDDCRDFVKAERTNLEAFVASLIDRGRHDEDEAWNSAGHDFYLSRNGHGAGYFDRDCGEAGDALQDAARRCSEADCVAYRNRLCFEGGQSMRRRPDAWQVEWVNGCGRQVMEFRTRNVARAEAKQLRGKAPRMGFAAIKMTPCFNGKRTWLHPAPAGVEA